MIIGYFIKCWATSSCPSTSSISERDDDTSEDQTMIDRDSDQPASVTSHITDDADADDRVITPEASTQNHTLFV